MDACCGGGVDSFGVKYSQDRNSDLRRGEFGRFAENASLSVDGSLVAHASGSPGEVPPLPSAPVEASYLGSGAYGEPAPFNSQAWIHISENMLIERLDGDVREKLHYFKSISKGKATHSMIPGELIRLHSVFFEPRAVVELLAQSFMVVVLWCYCCCSFANHVAASFAIEECSLCVSSTLFEALARRSSNTADVARCSLT
eukprot:s178_g62.t1